MRVLQGRVKFTINGTAKVIGPEDGVHTIRKYEVHDFCRADGGAGDEDVSVEEWTEPGKHNTLTLTSPAPSGRLIC